MPGLVGYTRPYGAADAAVLRGMQALLVHHPGCVCDPPFVDAYVCAARVRTDALPAPQPVRSGDLCLWFDGELYNQEALGGEAGLSDPALLLRCYREDPGFGFLRRVDGRFAAVLYDPGAQQLHLVTDRHGLRHLYWHRGAGRIAWASELKAFVAMPSVTPVIDEAAVRDFVEAGYLREARTWFDGVALLPPATVLTWDLREATARAKAYWSWAEVTPLEGAVDVQAQAEELGMLFREAVRRRARAGESVGLTLSGGLDSRAILAALPEHARPVDAVTFGRRGCGDIRLAARAARVRGDRHHVVELDGQRWLAPRLAGVWWTDGQMNLLHLHGVEAVRRMAQLFRIHLNGFLGDATVGGSYLGRGGSEVDLLLNRGRRFILLGPRLADVFVQTRLPFFDNAFLTCAMRVPAPLRAGARLYQRMLLAAFPDYFERIPWQKTGRPIRVDEGMLSAFGQRVRGRIEGAARRLRLGGARGSYHDYPRWLLQEPARSFAEGLLAAPDALYRPFLSRADVLGAWEELRRHPRPAAAERLCRYLTFELFLQQLFEGRFRSGGEASEDAAA